MKHYLIVLIACVFFCSEAVSQRNVRDSVLTSNTITVSYGFQIPGGDMAQRFGYNSSLGLDIGRKTSENLFFGVDGRILFGNDVIEPGIIQNLLTDNFEVLDDGGEIANVAIVQRGFSASLTMGKTWPIIGNNVNSGLMVKGGVGFLQHKIKLEHNRNSIAQLEGEYLKGYDRLTNGFMLHQFVGYHHMGSNRMTNFIVGVEAYQGFTKSRRDFNFDTQTVDDESRFDLLVGLRIGWVIHFYKRNRMGAYYY